MSTRRYTAWRFVHPDLDVPAAHAQATDAHLPSRTGLRLEARGVVQMVSEDDSVRQAVLLLLTTRPGERLMRPTYGCNLAQLVFSPNDDTTAAIAVHHVRRALERWEPRIDILKLDAAPPSGSTSSQGDSNVLLITLEYQVRTTRSREVVQLTLDMQGAAV
jgi:phage baseplate assembly protein W